ncbi:carbohydrate kinase family protein [Lentilitoribacter sp. EG35]|uniref:carbohydrate kinase family protein n=1 Tax=Lentilitoribacter sp. EG35 TaxID=3234192 RepID=UPI00345FBC26
MIITAGELLVEFVSHELDCGLAKTTQFSGPFPSGAPAIFASQAARVGAKCGMIGSVGNDPFGSVLIDRLVADGVNVDSVTTRSDHTTGTAFVSYFTNGSRCFVFHLNNTAADRELVSPVILPETIFHISGSSLGNTALRSGIMNIVEEVASVGEISFDPNIRQELMSDPETRCCLDKIMDVATYLLPSDADIDFLFPDSSPEDIISKMLAMGKKAVVVKQGADGAIGSCDGNIVKSNPIAVEEVDPTGAGDCFCGTFIGLIDQRASFEDALNAATIAGGLHVLERGPMEWNPTLEEINKHKVSERA